MRRVVKADSRSRARASSCLAGAFQGSVIGGAIDKPLALDLTREGSLNIPSLHSPVNMCFTEPSDASPGTMYLIYIHIVEQNVQKCERLHDRLLTNTGTLADAMESQLHVSHVESTRRSATMACPSAIAASRGE
jgi:hypothetical protein